MCLETLVKSFIWLLLFVFILNICLEMISSANTIENILGFLGIIGVGIVSYKTKCLTKIKIKRNEK
jgi:hypothetical protein